MHDSDEKRDRLLKEAFQYRVQLIAYARSLLNSYSAAEDVVQDAMLVVVRKFDQFTEGTSMLAWCRSIVRLEVLRLKQKRQRERSLTDRLLDDAIDAAFEEQQAEHVEDCSAMSRDVLENCLQKVSARGQDVLKARLVDGLSYAQIGERVDMTLEAVRKMLFRVRKQVRGCVEAGMRTQS